MRDSNELKSYLAWWDDAYFQAPGWLKFLIREFSNMEHVRDMVRNRMVRKGEWDAC